MKKKKGRISKQESSFSDFRHFISEMGLGDIIFRGHTFTWVYNRESEGFTQEKFDRFFGSTD